MYAQQINSGIADEKYKIVLLGDSGVGKSSIIDRFVRGQINQQKQPTIGIDFVSRVVRHRGRAYKLQLWDTAGQEKYRSLVPAYLRDSHCSLLVFEISNRQTFQNVKGWHNLLKEHRPQNTLAFLIANKTDVLSIAQSQYQQQIHQYAKEEGLVVVQVSAKTGFNINSVFQQVTAKLVGQSVKQRQQQKNCLKTTKTQQFVRDKQEEMVLQKPKDKRKRKCCH